MPDKRFSDDGLSPAHIRADGTVQSVAQHCRRTAQIAGELLRPLGLRSAGYLSGLMHDAGKCTDSFARYLTDAVAGKPVHRGEVNHTFAGVQYILKTFHSPAPPSSMQDVASELIAYAAGAHHALFDVVDADGRSGFERRLTQKGIDYDKSMKRFLDQCTSEQEIRALFDAATREIEAIVPAIRTLSTDNEEAGFYLGLLARLLLSAVIEGDRQDTARFMDPHLNGTLSDCTKETAPWSEALRALELHLAKMPLDTPIQHARNEVSCLCAEFASQPGGLYRLNVPTGGGKTLSGLRYALAHARKWNKQRIFYVAPLITILEQNADSIRRAVGNSQWVLEHHSNVVRDIGDEDELKTTQLLEESWNAPIIVTTLVQFLNALFSGRTSCARRFHALADSVILIDEVQTVPTHMLSLFNLAMNFLSQICHATVILCSATQPCLEETKHALRVSEQTPVPYSEALWKPFVRTKILFSDRMRLNEIPAFAEKELKSSCSLLLVCNTKREAEDLFLALKQEGCFVRHLSASMCPAHRRKVLSELFAALEEARQGGPKVLCVSTQLIEAGVDISFESAIRLCAGMDSVIQTAGRENRAGEYEGLSRVWIVQCENEPLTGLRDIQRGKQATISLLHAFRQNPDRFGGDLASDEAIHFYYRALYEEIRSGGENSMDYPVAEPHTTLLDLLSLNRKYTSAGAEQVVNHYLLRQSFKTAGGLFSVFDQETISAIVPYEGGKEIISQLTGMDEKWQLGEIRELLRLAKPYTVSLYAHQVDSLLKQGILMPLCSGSVLALVEGCYDEETGLRTSQLANCFLEV